MNLFKSLWRLFTPAPKTVCGRDEHQLDQSAYRPSSTRADTSTSVAFSVRPSAAAVLTGNDLISDLTNGANVVDGKPMYEYADEKKHDLDFMKKCCDQILESPTGGMMPAPFYFRRVAILSRKQKNYEQEILYCEKYIKLVKSVQQHRIDSRTPNEFSRLQQIMIEPFEKRLVKVRQLHSARQSSIGRAD